MKVWSLQTITPLLGWTSWLSLLYTGHRQKLCTGSSFTPFGEANNTCFNASAFILITMLKKFHLFLFFVSNNKKCFFQRNQKKYIGSYQPRFRFRSKAINATSKFCFGFSGSGSGSGVAETGFFRQNLRTPGLNLTPVSATISVSISLFLFLVRKGCSKSSCLRVHGAHLPRKQAGFESSSSPNCLDPSLHLT